MIGYRTLAYAAMLAASGAAGWSARGPAPPTPATPVATAAPALRMALSSASAAVDATPLIAVASDGNVTLRVEQQPLEWVLEEIAKQSGWTDVKARARPAAAPSGVTNAARPQAAAPDAQPMASCAPPAPLDAAPYCARSRTAARRSGSKACFARSSDGVLVPAQTLKWLYETDASERVRLAAFESYLESRADQLDALRQTLEAALYVPSAAIQREAKQRLDALQEMQRIDALPPHGGP